MRSDPLALFCFGPVHSNGVGLAYLLESHGVVLNVTSWRRAGPECAGPTAKQLSHAINTASHVLRVILERGAPMTNPRSKL